MKKTTRSNSYYKFFSATLCILGITSIGFAQCPTVSNPVQTFCDVQSPIIENLRATSTGGGVSWYATATSTTPLANSTGLLNGEDYYADDTSGTCGTRQRVVVTIFGPPAGLNFQGVCVDDPNEATISDLFAIGNDLRWYNVPTGGSALATSTTLIDSMIYYVDQANPDTGCRTSRRSVFVNVGVVPKPLGKLVQVFCSETQPTVADLTASGTNNWYSTISSATPLPLETLLIDGQNYFATTVDPPCESLERLQVTVNLELPNNSGGNGFIEICETGVVSTGSVDLFSALLGRPDNTGIWSGPLPTSNGSTGTVDVTGMTPAGSPYVFTYEVSSEACPPSSTTVSIIIIEGADPGINGTLVLCSNSAAQDLFDSLEGTPEPGGIWSPALAKGNGIFDPALDAAGIYTYTVQGVPPCGEASAIVTVTINPEANPGSNGALTLCINSAPVDLSDRLGAHQAGGTWSPALASGTDIFDPALDAAGTYMYNVSGLTPCGDASATVTVTVDPLPDPGTNGTLTLCSTDAGQQLFDSLEGTPERGGTWSPALASGDGFFNPALDTPGIYTYTVQGVLPCGEASATVTVTINPEANPGTNGTLRLCMDSSPVDLSESLGDHQAGGTWLPALASGTDFFDPALDVAGTYTYSVSGVTPCGDASAKVTVTIDEIPNAGANGRLVICSNSAAQDLFNNLGDDPDTGGTWSYNAAMVSGSFNPAQDPAGTYTYTVTNSCGSDSSIVIVALIPQPNIAGIALTANAICLNEAAEITIAGATQLANGTYEVTYTLSGANTTQQTLTVTISRGGTSISIPTSELTNAGLTTFTILDLIDPITGCGITAGAITAVPFNVEQPQTPELVSGGDTFCLDDVPTIDDLTSNLMGTDIITWYDALENGIPYPTDTALVDGTTYYASNSTANGCTNTLRLAVTVTFESCEPLEIIIPDGFSPNGDTINDDFLIRNLRERYPDFRLQIYNRYGNILYKGDTNTPNWDGTSNQGREMGNAQLPVGVYYYILELNDDNDKTIQGRVYLSR